MSIIRIFFRYCSYFFFSSGRNGDYPPFVQNICHHVLYVKKKPEHYKLLVAVREKQLRSDKLIEVSDLGAGSRYKFHNSKTLGNLTRNTAIKDKYALLLYRLIGYFRPEQILELGTATGYSTLYLALGNPGSTIYTLEGNGSLLSVAEENFRQLNIRNVITIKGDFDETLPDILNSMTSVDFVFIDGNHRRKPTIKYFELILSKSNDDTLFVFDDIRWSDDMLAAWNTICRHPAVSLSIDLFFIGLVFVRKGQKAQHFKIRY